MSHSGRSERITGEINNEKRKTAMEKLSHISSSKKQGEVSRNNTDQKAGMKERRETET